MSEPTPGELSRLIDAIDVLRREVRELRAETERENDKRDRRIFWSRVLIAAVFLFAVGALWVGREAQATGDDILRARSDARVVSCQRDNEAAAKQHQLWQGILALPRAEGSRPPDPATLAAFNMLLDDTFPTRDCSPAAVDAYFTTTTTPGG